MCAKDRNSRLKKLMTVIQLLEVIQNLIFT